MRDVAVVSGAGSGIGRACAERLAGAGYRVVLVGRRATALGATLELLPGDGHLAVPGDLTDPAFVEHVAAVVGSEADGVDALVHAAGALLPAAGAGLGALGAEMHATFATNVVSTAMLTEGLRAPLRDGRGRVVAVGSIAALRGGGVAYAASKAALHGWAFTMAQQLGPRGITVNVVAPGYVADTELFGGEMTPERHQRLVDQTLVGRAGTPPDVAALVEFLVSADAGHVTAQVVQVNGGALPR